MHGGPKGINQQLQLNDWGQFEMRLPAGTYDFFVGAVGFVPFAKAIRVQPDKPVVLKVKLKVDMEHLED